MDVKPESVRMMTASEGSSRSEMAPRRQLGGSVVGMSFKQWTRKWVFPETRSASRPFVQRLLPTSEPPVCLDRSMKGVCLSASPATLLVAIVKAGGEVSVVDSWLMAWRAWMSASSDLRQPAITWGGEGGGGWASPIWPWSMVVKYVLQRLRC